MKTMAFKLVENVLIVAHTTQVPSENEWTMYVDAVVEASRQKIHTGPLRHLIFTAGGGPNAGQRKASNDALQRINDWKNSPAAVVSSSAAVRGIVTVFSWFNVNIKSFSPNQIDDALYHLDIHDDTKSRVILALKHLKAELSIS